MESTIHTVGSHEQMWTDIKRMDVIDTAAHLRGLGPPQFVAVRFAGRRYLDVDLIDALRFWYYELRNAR